MSFDAKSPLLGFFLHVLFCLHRSGGEEIANLPGKTPSFPKLLAVSGANAIFYLNIGVIAELKYCKILSAFVGDFEKSAWCFGPIPSFFCFSRDDNFSKPDKS